MAEFITVRPGVVEQMVHMCLAGLEVLPIEGRAGQRD
jgi:hypothetical protein